MGFPAWDSLARNEEKFCSCLPLSFSVSASVFSYFSSFLSPFLCHRCAHGWRKHPSKGSSTERTSSLLAFHAVPGLCPSHGCQLPSFAAMLTILSFSSLSPIMSPIFFLSLCLMTRTSLCYCTERFVSHLQPIAPLAFLSCSKPKYTFQ